MKVVIAPDSFKESLSAPEVAVAIARGWRQVFADADILLRPMADGGEGTVDAVLAATGGERRECQVRDPMGRPVSAHWGWLGEEGGAVLEMAAASGLHRVPKAQRDATRASSYGTGELIREALDAGPRRIILGLGGSATNDGGAGLLQALGVRFLDAAGRDLAPGGAALADLARIDPAGLDPRLAGVELLIAADVDNPLCGPRGASRVFGPQKGADAAQVEMLDAALAHYAQVAVTALGEDHSDFPGTGAAGGLGFAARAFLGASFRPGIELVAELSGLVEALRGADLLITGEGRLDSQSLHGKTPVGVARLARAAGVPVLALVGSLGGGYQELYDAGIDAAFSLAPGPLSLEQAMAGAAEELQARACDLARLWRLARG
ncbi:MULTISPECIES: glycerate kinase [unclassified Pseudomonas]|uniref:glycerate kinase n=1 Tax=unclassified Pseudomonas TaxID=196821 RepID=UPI0024497BFD|nr:MULTISPECIES: glycerate kinase [unclassified Pseudomonas]MDG9927190.1 glycerate kinase [Pseudomonas sp. GD04042]MDH0482801.1 glycerate kinase [Pseudomonas sp. GD04015]MDH0602605.1 glycerate kinase [Pseudomonas sp. GD03869]